MFDFEMEGSEEIQWYFTLGEENIPGLKRAVYCWRGPVSVNELKCLWDEV